MAQSLAYGSKESSEEKWYERTAGTVGAVEKIAIKTGLCKSYFQASSSARERWYFFERSKPLIISSNPSTKIDGKEAVDMLYKFGVNKNLAANLIRDYRQWWKKLRSIGRCKKLSSNGRDLATIIPKDWLDIDYVEELIKAFGFKAVVVNKDIFGKPIKPDIIVTRVGKRFAATIKTDGNRVHPAGVRNFFENYGAYGSYDIRKMLQALKILYVKTRNYDRLSSPIS